MCSFFGQFGDQVCGGRYGEVGGWVLFGWRWSFVRGGGVGVWEGVAEKLGVGREDGCRDILTHFQIPLTDLAASRGWRKRGAGCFWISMPKIIRNGFEDFGKMAVVEENSAAAVFY